MNIDCSKMLMEHYKLVLESYEIIRKTKRSLVIKCRTNQGLFMLKQVLISFERLHFLLQATEYLRGVGVLIPKLVKTIHQNDYVRWEGNIYYLQEWVPSVSPLVVSVGDLIGLSKQIGMVHKLSLNYHSPNAHIFFKEINWEDNMKRALILLEGMRLVKSNREEVDFFLDAGKRVVNELDKSSSFQFLKNLPLDEQFLCHNDLHVGNLLKSEAGLFIIDWDLAKYDIPAKDLNGIIKIMGKVTGKWDNAVFESILEAYTQENPITDQMVSLLILYLTFPHNSLHLFVKELTQTESPQQIQSLLQFEKEKTEYLLKGQWDRYRVPPL
ncbi:phosphotransferase [Bacillus sp. 1P02SD]|uniref:phosphotransferase n=1 Tax=Bacillus sp. 1P02SD TaxID=3132264 RepID=UPI00399F3227